MINLLVGNVLYRIFITHNTFRHSTINEGHGLKSALKEGADFDIGIKAHNHKPHVEECVVRGEKRFLVSSGAYKGQDRYASRGGFPSTIGCTPGIMLDPELKSVIVNTDYNELKSFL